MSLGPLTSGHLPDLICIRALIGGACKYYAEVGVLF